MKRLTALILVLCLLLCACGKKPGTTAESTENTQPSTTEGPQKETEPTQPTQTEPAPTEAEVIRHPLTGEVLEEPWIGTVTAVMINNARNAMPQCGISQADVFCELEVEGGVTRCLALFSDLSNVEKIGPVRSARTGFNSLAASFNAILVHCGGSDFALNAQYGENGQIENWKHIDEMSHGSYFFRDKERQQAGYAYEHTLFTKGELLQQVLRDTGRDIPVDKSGDLQFQEGIDLKGEKAEEVVVTFKGTKTSTFAYDSQTGLYKMNQFGKGNIDGNTGEIAAFKNLLVIYTNQWLASNGVHVFYESIGSGEGYAAVNGKIVPITWSRADVYSPFTFTLADGSPLLLDVGSTYFAMVGIQNPISYQ